MKRAVETLCLLLAVAALVFSCAKKTPEEKLQEAVDAFRKRDPLGAIVLAHEILQENTTGPVALKARWLLFNCYASDRNWKECRRVLNEILDQTGLDRPEGQQAARLKIWTYEALGQTTSALVQAQNFLEAATTGTSFWAELTLKKGNYLRLRDQLTSAEQAFASVLENNEVPEEARFQALGFLTGCFGTTETASAGIEFFQKYLDDNPSTNIVPNVYMVMGHLASLLDNKKRADELFNKGFEHFEELYKQATGADKKVEVLIRYARAYNFKGDVEKAAALLRKGLNEFRTSPKNRLRLYYELASVYASNEKYDKAIEVCREIPSQFPNHPERIPAYFRIAEYHRRQKKYDDAIADYQEIIALFPGTRYAAGAIQEIRRTEWMRRKEAETSATLALKALQQATSGTAGLTSATAVSTPPAAGTLPTTGSALTTGGASRKPPAKPEKAATKGSAKATSTPAPAR